MNEPLSENAQLLLDLIIQRCIDEHLPELMAILMKDLPINIPEIKNTASTKAIPPIAQQEFFGHLNLRK